MDVLIRQRQRSVIYRWLMQRVLERSINWWGASVGIAAAVVIVVRLVGLEYLTGIIAPLCILAVVSPLVMWPLWLRDRPSRLRATAYLDQRIQANGLVMALSEQARDKDSDQPTESLAEPGSAVPAAQSNPNSDWHAYIRKGLEGPCLPALSCERTPLLRLALAVCFLAIAYALPQQKPEQLINVPTHLFVQDIREELNQLHEDKLIAKETYEELREQLTQLIEATPSADPQALWEGADRIREAMQRSQKRNDLHTTALAAAMQALQLSAQLTPTQQNQQLQRLGESWRTYASMHLPWYHRSVLNWLSNYHS